MSVEALLDRLDKVKSAGKGKWVACCPAHEDRSPSLSIRDDGGKTLIHCFAGCHTADVLGAIGMEMSDLFPSSDGTYEPDPVIRLGTVKFTAADALRCLVPEAGILTILAADLADGKVLSPEENERLLVAAGRITEAAAYVGVL